jgi:hypothetical protein
VGAPGALTAALELAGEGLAVFPCGPDKAPRTPRGFHDASTDPGTIEAWDWSDALIGAALPPGQIVLDVDPRNGGDETMAALKTAGHKLPRTRVVRTGGEGTHYYFTAPPDVELRGKLGPGVDVKRSGRGYVIVPPSAGYRLIRNEPAAPLPGWLLDVLQAPPAGEHGGEPSEPRYFPWEEGTAYGLAARDGAIEELENEPAGGRNDALNRATFALAQLVAGGELAEEPARVLLEETAAGIGLTKSETRKTIRSAWEAGSAEPRGAPPREPGADAGAAADAGMAGPVPAAEVPWLDWLVDEAPPAYLLDPIIPENAYVLVYGPAAASKSMVFAALGSQASRRGLRVTLYSLENPPHVDRHRLRRLGPDPDNFRATNAPLDLNDPEQFRALVERERDWGASIVVLDTYSHAFESRTEDGNARAIAFARRVRYLMHVVGCSVVVIDHTGYAQDGEPRDASAKRQQVDVAVLMDAEPWRPGQPARFRMENRKASRFGNPFELGGRIVDLDDGSMELRWDRGQEPSWA